MILPASLNAKVDLFETRPTLPPTVGAAFIGVGCLLLLVALAQKVRERGLDASPKATSIPNKAAILGAIVLGLLGWSLMHQSDSVSLGGYSISTSRMVKHGSPIAVFVVDGRAVLSTEADSLDTESGVTEPWFAAFHEGLSSTDRKAALEAWRQLKGYAER